MSTKEEKEQQIYFHYGRFQPQEITQELYDFSRPGVFLIKDFLHASFREKIGEEILRHQHLFVPSPSIYGQARQNLSSFYFGPADSEENKNNFLTKRIHLHTLAPPTLERLAEAYLQVHQLLGNEAGYGGKANSFGVHKYPVGEVGIDPHHDHSWYVNLISVVVIAGSGAFSVQTGAEAETEKAYVCFPLPGDLLLMRAPRTADEKKYRPRHSISNMTSERIVVVFRQDERHKKDEPKIKK